MKEHYYKVIDEDDNIFFAMCRIYEKKEDPKICILDYYGYLCEVKEIDFPGYKELQKFKFISHVKLA